jgi:hypothetical protein
MLVLDLDEYANGGNELKIIAAILAQPVFGNPRRTDDQDAAAGLLELVRGTRERRVEPP